MFDNFGFDSLGDMGGSSLSDGPGCLTHIILLSIALIVFIALSKWVL